MKILLCILPPVAPDMPPAGAASLAGALGAAGHRYAVWDANIDLYTAHPEARGRWGSAGWHLWQSVAEHDPWLHEVTQGICRAIEAQAPDGLAFSCVSAGDLFTRAALNAVRVHSPGLPVLLGGPAFFHEADIATFPLPPHAALCKGEGETAIRRWADAGCALPPHDRVYRLPLARLDSLPLPDFTPFTQDGYTRPGVLPLESSRGCVNRCLFCDDTVMWGRYRKKTPSRVSEEIQALGSSASRISFCDSLLNPTPRRMRELADHVGPHGLGWDGMLQCSGVDAPLASLLRASGCTHVFLGVESFDPVVHGALAKPGTPKDALHAVIALHSAGIRPSIGLIIAGPPLQTRQQFAADLRVLEDLAPCLDAVAVNPLCIPQGTALWAQRSALGIHWPEHAPWRNWHAGGGNADVARRFAWCAEARNLLRSLGLRVEEEPAHVEAR